MKVLQVNPYPPDHLGGSEIFCKNLSINLKKKRNIDSEILTSDVFKRKIKNDLIEESIKVHYKRCYHNLWGKNPIVNMYSFMKKNYQKYDLIHAHSYIFFTSAQCALLRKIRKFPFILHIHGGVQTPLLLSSNLIEYFQLLYKRSIFDKIIGKLVIKNSDSIISVSKKDLDFIRQNYDLSKKVCYYIPNAVDIERFKRIDTINRRFITFIGRLSYIKGFDIFIKVIKELYKEDNSLKFLIIGNGPLKNLVEKAKKELPITYKEYFPYEKIEKVYNMSKLIMLTSRFEGVPTTILESLACETPVITSNVGGVSEIIKHRENGFLFNIDKIFQETDNMLKLISNEKTLNNFGKNGRNLIKKEFSWEKVSEEIEKVYRNMLN